MQEVVPQWKKISLNKQIRRIGVPRFGNINIGQRSRSQCQKRYQWKGLVTRNTHVNVKAVSECQSKCMTNVKVHGTDGQIDRLTDERELMSPIFFEKRETTGTFLYYSMRFQILDNIIQGF